MGSGRRYQIRKLKAEHCFAKNRDYLVKLNVVDKLTKQVALNQASDSFLVEDIEQPYIMAPDTVFAGKDLIMNGQKTFLKNFKINGYYWDFGDGSRSAGIETKHAFHFPGSYDLQLGVTGEP